MKSQKAKIKAKGKLWEKIWSQKKKKKELQGKGKRMIQKSMRKHSRVAGNGRTTHEGEDMNVISSHSHHFNSEENVRTQFKGNKLKDSWDQKKNKIQQKKL